MQKQQGDFEGTKMSELGASYWAEAFMEKQRAQGNDKARWNRKAPSFGHKPKRSDYIAQLIDKLALEPSESVFDMGCGPGTLSIPLAKRGHHVYAVDFSEGMLAQLEANMPKNAQGRIETFTRSWQENWDDLPCADVSISSRSLIVDDLPDAIAKLESKAKKRAVITVVAGQTPWRDARINDALGRPPLDQGGPSELIALANYLFATGRLPRLNYIEYPRTYSAENREELTAFIEGTVKPDNEEATTLHEFIDEHLVQADDGSVTLDYQSTNRWAIIWWPVGSQD